MTAIRCSAFLTSLAKSACFYHHTPHRVSEIPSIEEQAKNLFVFDFLDTVVGELFKLFHHLETTDGTHGLDQALFGRELGECMHALLREKVASLGGG